MLRVQYGANTLDFGDVGEGEHHPANAAGQQGNEDGLAGEQVHADGDGVGEGALRPYGGIDSDFSVAGLRPPRLSSHSASPVARSARAGEGRGIRTVLWWPRARVPRLRRLRGRILGSGGHSTQQKH